MSSSDRAVSPVVAVILLVAVTVTLSAVIGGFALELGQSTTDGQAQTNTGVSESLSNGTYTAQLVTGDPDELRLLVNGTVVDSVSNPSVGASVSAQVTNNDSVTVLTVTGGQTTVATTTTVSTTTTNSTVTAPTSGLIAHWTFETGSGSTAVDSAGTYNGTISGSTWYSTAKVGDYALDFDGTDDTVDTPPLPSFSAYTVAFWSYADTVSDGNYHQQVAFKENNPIEIRNEGNGTQYFYHKDGSGTWNALSAPTSASTWEHWTVVWNGSEMRLYKNGRLVNSTAASGAASVKNRSSIGSIDTVSNFYDGRLDDVRVYNRSLNDSEVSDLYNATK